MYISYKHKVIFIHCRKAAGSSISYHLSQVGGARDLQLSAITETLDEGKYPPLRTFGAALSNGYAWLALTESLISGKGINHAVANAAKSSFKKRLGSKPQHASAEVVREVFSHEWENFKSFCVARNSYDMAVSDYFWRTRNSESPPSFDYYLQALREKDPLNGLVPIDNYYNWPRYTSNDQIIVNKVLRYENILTEISKLFEDEGIPMQGPLPKLKSKYRPESIAKSSLRDFYTSKTRLLVYQLYEEEIEYFQYGL